MKQYIQKIRSKPDHERKQYALLWTIVSMAFVGGVWIYSMSDRFNSNTKVQAKEDIKPFSLLGKSLSDTYSNISASIGSAKLQNDTKASSRVTTQDKVIDLIPIEPTQ